MATNLGLSRNPGPKKLSPSWLARNCWVPGGLMTLGRSDGTPEYPE